MPHHDISHFVGDCNEIVLRALAPRQCAPPIGPLAILAYPVGCASPLRILARHCLASMNTKHRSQIYNVYVVVGLSSLLLISGF